MNFATKIFLSIFIITFTACGLLTLLSYHIYKNETEQNFASRYETFGSIIGSTFHHLETTTDHVNKNAVLLLSEIETNKGIPTDKDLSKLAKELGINALYVIKKDGRFIRSSDLPIAQQHNSLFSYNKDYRLLVHGNLPIAVTPIIPSYPYDVPAKLTMIPSHNKNFILEAGTHLEYISKILHQIISSDKNIESIGLYTPNGYELGSLSALGHFHQGRQNATNDLFTGHKITGDTLIISVKVPASIEKCLECIQKNVLLEGNYFYYLKIQISLTSLNNRLHSIKYNIFLALIVILILSIIASKIISNKLVTRIEKINNIANEIILSKNLNLQVPIENSKDEIANLALTFNAMIQSLKTSQESLIESEKMREIVKLSAHVAHDIRSPLAAMEMSLFSSSKNPEDPQVKVLREAIQSVRDIANNLLARYRDPSNEKNTNHNATHNDNGNISRYLLVSSIVESVVLQKKQEWIHNPCNINFTISEKSKSTWILAAPNDMKRIISNLLNNAHESLKNERAITISLFSDNSSMTLKIVDSGHGIPEEQISNALDGKSFKQNGNGIGLFSAKYYIESLHGQLNLSSSLTTGTTVDIILPIIKQPIWFPKKITVLPDFLLIALDDDATTHNLLRHRAELIGRKSLHFMRSIDLAIWHKNNPELNKKAVYFINYELKDDYQNGLDFLVLLDIASSSYIITHHAEEVVIQRANEEAGTCLIPKCLLDEINFIVDTSVSQPEE